MAKDKIKINFGCGSTILSFFLGLIGFVFVVGIILLVFVEILVG